MRNFKTAALAILVVVLSGLTTTPASAVTVESAAFSGGDGTVTVGSTLYAKQGAVLTLTFTTQPAKCVVVDGAFSAGATSATEKTSWTFTTTAGAGDGIQTVTAAASDGFNGQGNCTGSKAGAKTASYTLDNTGPVVTSVVQPAAGPTPNQPNAAGWFNVTARAQFSATDAGVGGVDFPSGSSFTLSGGVREFTAVAVDALGNKGNGKATVKVDRQAPRITATQTRSGTSTTVTFTCVDDFYTPLSDNSGVSSCLANGSTTSSRTISGNGTVRGTATDVAGNVSTLDVVVENVDTTDPLLSGAPTTSPTGTNGWYTGNVTIHWTASDPESGIPSPPADTTIAAEGTGLTSTQSVMNGAGRTSTAVSSPAVKIDKTAPTTSITSATDSWTRNGTVVLSASDALSLVDHTEYAVGDGAWQTGSTFTLGEGVHPVRYRSVDKAGNVETAHSATVYVDQTAPSITHGFLPDTYTDGTWTNHDVTVVFVCGVTGGSPLDSCTADQPVTAEGTHLVSGTARDQAGNEANSVADVRIDKTPPTIAGAPDRTPDHNGWYNLPVTVSFAVADQANLSGLASSPAPVELVEGRNQSVTRSVKDNAGNSASDSAGPFDVDLTDPRLTGSFAAGWHTGPVTVSWTCEDDLSGSAGNPANSTVTGEGNHLSATESCQDVAGNSTSTTVRDIQIDSTAPTTLGSVPAVPDSGWYDDDVEVTLTADDNLSGVADTFYAVDGGDPQAYEGPFSFGREGTHEIAFWSVDEAGNAEIAGAPITLKIDKTAPETTKINPLSPASGWFVTSGIPFAYSATDGENGSGVAKTYFTIDGGDPIEYGGEQVEQALSTGQHTVTYWSVDIAGNAEAERSFEVNVDTVKPVIKGSRTPANAFGWNKGPVDVTFECTDEGSTIDSVVGCGPDARLSNEGSGQSVTGHTADVAGNEASATVSDINIDKTAPTLQGVKPDANGANWYRDDVVVDWRGDDALSKIDTDTQPPKSRITGEGRNLGAGPFTIFDKAGNESEAASVTGVNIDRTAPGISGAPTRTADSNGWYNHAVTVRFDCSDPDLADDSAGSGVASCPGSEVVSADGADQSVTSGVATDRAGNERAGTSVGDIDVDSQAPVTAADNQCTLVNAWCVGDTASVVLTATDQADLSGVDSIHYRVNGGEEQSATGGSTTVSVPLTGTGAGTVSYWAVDVAGNRETANSVALKWDNLAPVVTHTVSPAANAGGWNKSNATVHFDAADESNGSGVEATTVSPDVIVSEETDGSLVKGSATDKAGNVGRDSVTVKLDKTAPRISGAITVGTPGDNGWYTSPVRVHFTCDDALSLIATCTQDVTLTDNGSEQSVGGSAQDRADNTSSTTVSGIKIDQEKPTLTTADVNIAGGRYTLGTVPTGTCNAKDSFSGVASCVVTVSGGNANGVGTFSYTATATDKAGNTKMVTGTYTVIYGWSGYLQPINDTAHQGETASIFKAGSTVPVKFQLKDSAGRVVQSPNAPKWLEPVKGSAMNAPVDETAYTALADSGTTFRYDATERQYIYNWKTGKTGGNYWRVGVTLDDGQTYYVNIGLR